MTFEEAAQQLAAKFKKQLKDNSACKSRHCLDCKPKDICKHNSDVLQQYMEDLRILLEVHYARYINEAIALALPSLKNSAIAGFSLKQ